MNKSPEEIREIILALKNDRISKGKTVQEIYEEVLAKCPQDCPSFSTIKSIYAEGSENKSFKYETSLRPIVTVVMKAYEKSEEYNKEEAEDYFRNQEVFKHVLQLKNQEIDNLNSRIETLITEKEFIKRQLEYLMIQFDDMKATRDRLLDMLKDQKGG